MRPVVGRVQIDRDASRPPVESAPMPLDDARRQLAPHPIEGRAARVVLKPRDRRLRRQPPAGHRVASQQQLVDRIVGEMVGIVAIGMAAGDTEDPLADQVLERVPNLLRRAFIHQTAGERLDQAIHPLGRLEQHGPAIRTRLLAVEGGHERLVEQIREPNSLWYRGVRHARASVVPKTFVVNSVLAHGGFCVSTGAGVRCEFSRLANASCGW